MLIEVDQATYNRVVKYSSHVGISAKLVVKEALNEWIDEWEDADDVEVEQAPESQSKSKSSAFPPTPITCIDTSDKFLITPPTVGLVDLLSVQ